MALKETLMQDLKDAMKDKDTIRKNTVQMIRSAILQFEKDNLTELDEEGVLEVIAKELKKRRDVLPEYEKSGRDDLIADIKREIEILLGYLPAQLTREELEEIVVAAIFQIVGILNGNVDIRVFLLEFGDGFHNIAPVGQHQ